MHKQDAILHNISLKPYNTFGIDVKAENFIAVSSLKELKEVFLLKEYPTKFILGGGSNMLLTKDVDDLVVNINLKGKEIISENGNTTLVKVKAGENWHEFVLWALSQNLGGVENLSLIPGNVGTAPIQNIGAYGVELKDVFYSCEALNTKTLEVKPFFKEECNFGYRDSYFKRNKGEYIITSVTFKLTNTDHKLNISYGAIEAELKNKKVAHPTITDISNAVISIRKSKLPDPKELGNSGSFFKNPIVSTTKFEQLKTRYPELPHWPMPDGTVKLAAAWLVDSAGLKGTRQGQVGIHQHQAIVLVNHGEASGADVVAFAQSVSTRVEAIFGLQLEIEPRVYQ